MKRTITAFLLAPAVAGLMFSSSAGVTLAFTLSYALSYVFGIPVFLVLRHWKRERHVYYIISGFACGALYVLVPALANWRTSDLVALFPALIFAMAGSGVALTFSLLRGHERRA